MTVMIKTKRRWSGGGGHGADEKRALCRRRVTPCDPFRPRAYRSDPLLTSDILISSTFMIVNCISWSLDAIFPLVFSFPCFLSLLFLLLPPVDVLAFDAARDPLAARHVHIPSVIHRGTTSPGCR